MDKPTIGHYASHQRDVTAQEDAALNAALRSSTVKVEHPEIARLRAELAELSARIEDTDSACADYAFAGAHTAREIIEKLHERIRGYKGELAEARRDVEIVRFLRCGGWEVLQNPKYWTLENKFYGAIAEAMAEVAAEGDKNGDA